MFKITSQCEFKDFILHAFYRSAHCNTTPSYTYSRLICFLWFWGVDLNDIENQTIP